MPVLDFFMNIESLMSFTFRRPGIRKTTTTLKSLASWCGGVTHQRTRRKSPAARSLRLHQQPVVHQHHGEERFCTEHVELLSVALRPLYLPREFNQLFITVVYIPLSSDTKVAADKVSCVIHRLSSLSPDAPSFILGDFNECRLNRVLPNFRQCVTCSTHGEQIIDLCYGNIKGAFQSRSFPGLGRSDHNTVQLTPVYKSKWKRSKPIIRSVNTGSKDAKET